MYAVWEMLVENREVNGVLRCTVNGTVSSYCKGSMPDAEIQIGDRGSLIEI
jgi:hypothetical protein